MTDTPQFATTLEAMAQHIRDAAIRRGCPMTLPQSFACAEAAALAICKGPWDEATGRLNDAQLLGAISRTFCFKTGKIMLVPTGAEPYWEDGEPYQFLPLNVCDSILHNVTRGIVGDLVRDNRPHAFDDKWTRNYDKVIEALNAKPEPPA